MYKREKQKTHQRNDKYKHSHHKEYDQYDHYDPQNPTFSSSLLDQVNKSLKTHPKKEVEDEFKKNKGGAFREEKMSSLRRACMVEKWMEKKVISCSRNPSSSSTKRTTLLDEFDVQDMFFSTTSKTEYSVYFHSRSNPVTPSYKPPPIPKPVRTKASKQRYLDSLDHTTTIESRYLDQYDPNKDEVFIKTRPRAHKIYSNLKSLKQPISPGARLSNFLSSLFVKENKREKKTSKKECKSEQASTCSSASSFSRSCLSKNSSPSRKKNQNGTKRTVSFCPSAIVDEKSHPCAHKSLYKDHDYEDNRHRMSSKLAKSISKRYEELKKLNVEEQKMQLEEVALDLLNGYWDAELSKSHSQSVKTKVNDDDYGVNHASNYDQEEDDDGLSCSSSDLFELEHLSLIGDELPVYETTQFDPKIM